MIVTKKAEKAKLLSKEVFPNLIMSLKRQDVMSLKDFLLFASVQDRATIRPTITTTQYKTLQLYIPEQQMFRLFFLSYLLTLC